MGVAENVLLDIKIGIESIDRLINHLIYLIQLLLLQQESQGLEPEQLPPQEIDLLVLALNVKEDSLQLDLVVEVVVFYGVEQVVDGEDGDAASHDIQELERGVVVLSLKNAQFVFERLQL